VALAAGLVLVVAFSLYLLRIRPHNAGDELAETDRYAPVRLTNTTTEDVGAHWTKDGRIRFWRVYANHRTESWIMSADGTNQTQVKDFAH